MGKDMSGVAKTRIVGGGNAQLTERRAHLRRRQLPGRIRKDGKAAEQALLPQNGQHPILTKYQHHAAHFDALRFFSGLDRQVRSNSPRMAFTVLPHRAEQAGGAFRRTHRRAHLHHGVGKRAWTVRRHKLLRQIVNHAAALRAAHLL